MKKNIKSGIILVVVIVLINITLKVNAKANPIILDDKDENITVFKENEAINKTSILPKKTVIVPGGIELIVEAKIRDGEKAVAILNGEKYKMKRVGKPRYTKNCEMAYVKYRAFIKIDKTSKEKSLGKVAIELEDKSEIVYGGEIIVTNKEMTKDIIIDNYNAKLYDGLDTSYVPLEDLGAIPKDTIVEGKALLKIDDKEYYLLKSGYRIKKEDGHEIEKVLKVDDKENNIKIIDVFEDSKYTTVKIKTDYKGEYVLKSEGKIYKDYKNKDFTVEEDAVDKIYLKFINGKVSIDKLNIEEGSIIKKIKKENKNKIKLSLNKNHYGYYSFYDKDNILNIKFRKKIENLKGAKIIIDPGHGATNKGYLDPGALGFYNITEHSLNKGISKRLEKLLKEKGAEVIVLNTTDKIYSLKDRPKRAYIEEADMFISIHHNSGGSGVLNKPEVYYNSAFSKSLGSNINKELVKIYKEKLFPKEDFGKENKWDYYTVLLEKHCPAVLVEVGYIDNQKVFDKIAKKESKEILAKGILKGIEEFTKESNQK